jgi:tryptophan synthase alpha subunit
MTEHIRNVFQANKQKASHHRRCYRRYTYLQHIQDQPTFVTFVTAGFPTHDDTVPILIAMQEGGADIIELGMPFSDPIADGPAIQESNSVRAIGSCA